MFTMNPAELKNKMKSLWRDTFHDSDAYINLVFDNYFNPDLLEYEEMNGDVVAGLLGVPYSFGNSDRQVRGLYLCGLATKPQYRSRGIMTRMLARINEKALKAGFAFTFLIPADAGLRKYYKDRDYVNAFYRIVDNYTSLHDFDREYDSILLEQKEKVSTLKRKYYDLLQTGKISIDSRDDDTMLQVGKLIESKEKGQLDLRIIHSEKDIAALMEEALVNKGMIYYVKSQSGVVTGAAFKSTKTIDNANGPIAVPSHCWKVLLRQRGNQNRQISQFKADELKAIGFVFTNDDAGAATSIESAVRSVKEIEELTGFKFFRNLDPAVADAVKSQKNLADW